MNKDAKYSHSFVCSDTSTGKIVWIDHDGNVVKELVAEGACFDIWSMPDGKFLCMDRIACGNGDYIDIGHPLAEATALPVIVKQLIFS